jgi:farnesyl-diphosphate farnesyltransferase
MARYIIEEKLRSPQASETKDENFKFCDYILGKVSRSFSAVIRQLPAGLCEEILVFYLTLRALDTVEDDMEVYIGRQPEKLEMLRTFYKQVLEQGLEIKGVGQGDERTLLE